MLGKDLRGSIEGNQSFETDSFSIRDTKVKIKGLLDIETRSIPEGEIKLVGLLKTALRVTVQFVVTIEKVETPSGALAVGIDVGHNLLSEISDGCSVTGRELDHSKVKELERNQRLQTCTGISGEHYKPKTKCSNAYNSTQYKLGKAHERILYKRP